MGLWDEVRSQVRQVVVGAGARSGAATGSAAPSVPDAGSLLTEDEIAAATGSRPLGEGDAIVACRVRTSGSPGCANGPYPAVTHSS